MRTAIALFLLAFALASCSVLGSDSGEESSLNLTPIDFLRFSQAPPLLVGRWAWTRSNIYGPEKIYERADEVHSSRREQGGGLSILYLEIK